MKNLILSALIFGCSFLTAFAQDSGGVKGKVRNAKGDGIAGASVIARQNGADVKSVKSDASGRFVLDGLQAGIYNIVFDKSGYASGVKYSVEVEKNKTRDLGDRLILAVDQGTQVIVKGSVFNQDGRSVGGAKIEIERVLSDGSTKKLGSSYTNISGEFTFRFPEGADKFRVTASVKDAAASKEIEVSSAAIYRLAISLKLSEK